MHHTTPQFWERFAKLPEPVQKIARKNFELLKQNPKHPSLHFKRINQFWSVRVGLSYRALAIQDDEDFIWVWIGTHNEYDKLLR
ncbi:type II toxin-antitoxin system RelE family toxin [Candidatus Leptofilum sp.]|uniref:type II toxin-antitoxin system RelE family toxin n=1 Tax=Candidatus Leptofilum sp. TaxID=3241576 RepID=UPI003B59540B